MWEGELGHDEPRHMCLELLPLFIAQCDGGPQPWISWHPRSGREVKLEWDSVSIRWVPIGAIRHYEVAERG
jgi:hypothetical protein